MRISIAMATYNGAKYISEQLNSFISQSRQPDEVVICDDSSTDNTIEILEKFKGQAPFSVHIYKNEKNLGFTKNFEKALSNCSGDLIFLSDQDDIWFDNKIAVLEKTCLDNPDKLVFIHDGNLVDEKLVWHGTTKLGQIMAGYNSQEYLITGALTAIRKDFLFYVLPIPLGVVGHDIWLHKIAAHLDTRLVIKSSLQYIRRHSTNTSAWIANSTKKINRIKVFISQYQTSPAIDYGNAIASNEACRLQLNKIFNHENIPFSRHVIKRNLHYLEAENRAINYRANMLRAGIFKRKIMVILGIFLGHYRFFNGYKSLLRDIMR